MPGNSLVSVIAAGLAPRIKSQTLQAVDSRGGGWLGLVRESFPGAWQRGITVDSGRDVLAFSAVFACTTVTASDVAKLRVKLVEEDENGIDNELKNSPYIPVLRKPNHYQTRIQFWEQWILSKLLYGNTYALKGRDQRGIVTALYILDAQRVTPLVAESGDVYYQLSADHLSGLEKNVTVPASEIIHDRMNCLWHPLVGVSPIYACGISATQGRRIQANATKFFDNMSRPSGMLTAPGSISDEKAEQLKARWEENFSGGNVGRTAILGDGLKYEAMTIPAQEAQLIEQLRFTVEDVARCFHMPLFKIGGPVPPGSSIESLNQIYYSDCLQRLIESAELCLDEGLGFKAHFPNYYTEFDLDGLLRMDRQAQITMLSAGVSGSIFAPNEGRLKLNLPPVDGGESPMAQHQQYSLAALAKRDALADPFGIAPKPSPAPAANDAEAEREAAALLDRIARGLCDTSI